MRVLYALISGLLIAIPAVQAGQGDVGGAVLSNCGPAPSDLDALSRNVLATLRQEYSQPRRFTYLEQRRDIDISRLGKVTVGPLRTFEVYPAPNDDEYKRLIAVDGKPLDATELARRDAEHERNLQRQAERERTESPNRRAARLKKEADERRERDEIFEDAGAVFDVSFVCRETLNAEPVLVLALKARPDAQVKTREGEWMKKLQGRMWVSADGHHIARLHLQAFEDLAIGWGVVARVEAGSGFDYVRKRVGDAWLPSQLKLEGSGRTLLFRRFQVTTVTTYTNHQPYKPNGS
jgi:hypothetical protein